MDIKDLTDILIRCKEDNSIDGLLKAVGVESGDMKKGDGIEITLSFNKKEDGNIDVELSKKEMSKDRMKLEELEDYSYKLDVKFDELLGKEPEDKNSDEHAEWEDKVDELQSLMLDTDDKIDELKQKLSDNGEYED